jgi:steroid delta-isomerase-like uncharacterized protein
MSKVDYELIDRRCFEEVWTPGNLDAVGSFYHADFVCHHPPDPDIVGPDGIRQQIRRTHDAYADLSYTVVDHVTEGERTVSRWRMDGTVRRSVRGSDSTGQRVTNTGLTLFHYADDLIREEWTYWDQLGLQKQLKP